LSSTVLGKSSTTSEVAKAIVASQNLSAPKAPTAGSQAQLTDATTKPVETEPTTLDEPMAMTSAKFPWSTSTEAPIIAKTPGPITRGSVEPSTPAREAPITTDTGVPMESSAASTASLVTPTTKLPLDLEQPTSTLEPKSTQNVNVATSTVLVGSDLEVSTPIGVHATPSVEQIVASREPDAPTTKHETPTIAAPTKTERLPTIKAPTNMKGSGPTITAPVAPAITGQVQGESITVEASTPGAELTPMGASTALKESRELDVPEIAITRQEEATITTEEPIVAAQEESATVAEILGPVPMTEGPTRLPERETSVTGPEAPAVTTNASTALAPGKQPTETYPEGPMQNAPTTKDPAIIKDEPVTIIPPTLRVDLEVIPATSLGPEAAQQSTSNASVIAFPAQNSETTTKAVPTTTAVTATPDAVARIASTAAGFDLVASTEISTATHVSTAATQVLATTDPELQLT